MKRYRKIALAAALAAMVMTGCGSSALEDGLEQLEAGNYEKAVDDFQEAVDKNKNPGDAYRGIGIAKWEMGEYEESLSAFENALENDAERTGTIYNFMGNCEMQLGNAKMALNYYNLGLECEDNSDEMTQEMLFNQIVAYEQVGEWDNAKLKLEAYVAAYPDDERAAKEMEFLTTQR